MLSNGIGYFYRFLSLSIASICLLNLNGVGVMLVGINQLFSPLLLLISLLLILIGLRKDFAISTEFGVYLLAIAAYLIIGGIVGILATEAHADRVPSLLLRYFTAIIVTIAGYYSILLCYSDRVEPIKIILVLSVIATFFIPFGSELNTSGRIIVDSQRGAGLFGNPNEAGIIAAMGLACTLTFVKRKYLAVTLSLFFISMAVLTFSKAVLLMLIMVYFANLLLKGNISTGAIRLIAGGVLLFSLLIAYRSEIVANFDGNQAKRIDQFFSILMLEPSEESVESSRGYLWKQGMEYIYKHPIVGNGLGALHSMEGASVSVNDGKSQGVHNSYLLKFGDSGILAFFAFVFFIIISLYQSFKLAKYHIYARVSFAYFMIFALDCVATHNVELLRFHNYLIGTSFAFLYIARKSLAIRN